MRRRLGHDVICEASEAVDADCWGRRLRAACPCSDERRSTAFQIVAGCGSASAAEQPANLVASLRLTPFTAPLCNLAKRQRLTGSMLNKRLSASLVGEYQASLWKSVHVWSGTENAWAATMSRAYELRCPRSWFYLGDRTPEAGDVGGVPRRLGRSNGSRKI